MPNYSSGFPGYSQSSFDDVVQYFERYYPRLAETDYMNAYLSDEYALISRDGDAVQAFSTLLRKNVAEAPYPYHYGPRNIWKQDVQSLVRFEEQMLWSGSVWWREDGEVHANPDLLRGDLSASLRFKLKLAELTGYRRFAEWKFYKYGETEPFVLPPPRKRGRLMLALAFGR